MARFVPGGTDRIRQASVGVDPVGVASKVLLKRRKNGEVVNGENNDKGPEAKSKHKERVMQRRIEPQPHSHTRPMPTTSKQTCRAGQ